MIENKTVYTNYGDINPIEHGGIFVNQESETEFRIIKLTFIDHEEKNVLWDMYVDVSDNWIEYESVENTCDVSRTDNLQFAIACTEYYSPANFGCDEDIFLTLDESAGYLKEHYGIEVE